MVGLSDDFSLREALVPTLDEYKLRIAADKWDMLKHARLGAQRKRASVCEYTLYVGNEAYFIPVEGRIS